MFFTYGSLTINLNVRELDQMAGCAAWSVSKARRNPWYRTATRCRSPPRRESPFWHVAPVRTVFVPHADHNVSHETSSHWIVVTPASGQHRSRVHGAESSHQRGPKARRGIAHESGELVRRFHPCAKEFVTIQGGAHFAVFMKSSAFLDQLVSRVLPRAGR